MAIIRFALEWPRQDLEHIWRALLATEELRAILGDDTLEICYSVNHEMLLEAAARGEPYDGVGDANTDCLMAAGVLQPIDEWVAHSRVFRADDYLPEVWRRQFHEGRQYSVPAFESGPFRYGFQYNARLVREAGLATPDTVSDVIHDAAQRPHGRRRSSIVDNSAEPMSRIVDNLSSCASLPRSAGSVSGPESRPSGCATLQPRFVTPEPSRRRVRSPACDAAPAPTSQRTPTPRGLRIRLTHGGPLAQHDASTPPVRATPGAESSPPAGAPVVNPVPAVPNHPSDAGHEPFGSLTHFGGFDWAMDEHQFVVIDPAGTVLLNLRFRDDASGWAELRAKVAAFGRLGVAIETSCGPAVERLLELGVTVYPINPKAAERFRDRKSPAGVKNDALDAWCFADALRTDGHGWRDLRPLDPLTAELRILCRDEMPLFVRTCPSGAKRMKIIAFIEARQEEVIRKILQHCGLWHDPPPRAPPRPPPASRPSAAAPQRDPGFTCELDPDFLEHTRREQNQQFDLPWEP